MKYRIVYFYMNSPSQELYKTTSANSVEDAIAMTKAWFTYHNMENDHMIIDCYVLEADDSRAQS